MPLEHHFGIEVAATEAPRSAGRVRYANLPTGATLADFDYHHTTGMDPALLAERACRRIDTAPTCS